MFTTLSCWKVWRVRCPTIISAFALSPSRSDRDSNFFIAYVFSGTRWGCVVFGRKSEWASDLEIPRHDHRHRYGLAARAMCSPDRAMRRDDCQF
jgi:hypothetical protein